MEPPEGSRMGGLVVQVTADLDIWLRTFERNSFYGIDDVEELKTLIGGSCKDEILWVIGYKEDRWEETSLVNRGGALTEREKGITYNVISWSGTLDETLMET